MVSFKHLITFTVLIIFSFKGYAQSFLTTINTAEDDFSSSAVELRAGGYLLVISRGVGAIPITIIVIWTSFISLTLTAPLPIH